jgi:hypothetical protein
MYAEVVPGMPQLSSMKTARCQKRINASHTSALGAFTNFNTKQVYRDYEQVRAWAGAHQIQMIHSSSRLDSYVLDSDLKPEGFFSEVGGETYGTSIAVHGSNGHSKMDIAYHLYLVIPFQNIVAVWAMASLAWAYH